MNMKHSRYGLLIITTILAVIGWVQFDAQAASDHPGWTRPFHRYAFCYTLLPVPDNPDDAALFPHYPGKRLKRVLRDGGVKERQMDMALARERHTDCYRSWEEAAAFDPYLQAIAKDYQDIVAIWDEELYEQAILTIYFTPNKQGPNQLRLMLQQLQQLKGEMHGSDS